jgi:hypothetical protein
MGPLGYKSSDFILKVCASSVCNIYKTEITSDIETVIEHDGGGKVSWLLAENYSVVKLFCWQSYAPIMWSTDIKGAQSFVDTAAALVDITPDWLTRLFFSFILHMILSIDSKHPSGCNDKIKFKITFY